MVKRLTIVTISRADLQMIHAVEHIELGQGHAVDTANLDGLAHHDRVKPATASRPFRHGAELSTPLAETSPDVIIELGREWPFAYPCRVSLGDAENKPDAIRPMPDPDAAAAARVLEEVTKG